MSEGQEVALGRETDPQILSQFGDYPDPGVQAYVAELGLSLAARSERPDLPWTFRVLDDPLVNAFALPGGFIYVTRGILTHLGSEAELVGVLGHEIGHVTARHGASQMSKQIFAQAGLGVGAILAPEYAQTLGSLAQTGLGLLFLKYGRDDERQADRLGLRYATRGGYDPREMAGVFDLLGRVSAASGGGEIPSWLSTHPAPENRSELLRREIAAADLPAEMRVEKETYLRRLDGMVFGDDPRQGYFDDGTFYHPGLAFQFAYPPDWRTVNGRQAVIALSPQRDAILRLTLAAEGSAAAAADRFFSAAELRRGSEWRRRVNDLPASSWSFDLVDSSGSVSVRGLAAFVELGGRVYELLAYTQPDKVATYAAPLQEAVGSFRPVTNRRILEVEPMRVAIERLERATRLADLDASVSVETLALLNDVEPDATLAAGTLVKTVVGFDPRREGRK